MELWRDATASETCPLGPWVLLLPAIFRGSGAGGDENDWQRDKMRGVGGGWGMLWLLTFF